MRRVSVVAMVRPERGTRPANRRALIIEAAAELFHEHGYEHVNMRDIADAVNVGPSALYRHFPGKQHLLIDVVRAGLEPIRDLISELDLRDRSASSAALAALGLEHRYALLTWQRDARHLSPDEQAVLRAEVRELVASLQERVGAVRHDVAPPEHDLIAMAMLSTVFSPAFHQAPLPRGQYEALLAGIAVRVLDGPVGTLGTSRPVTAGLRPRSRREVILAEAVRQFAVHGYASVSIDDIAGALGMAGPSVYNHFPSKIDMLIIPLQRGAGYLMTQLAEVLTSTTDPAAALRNLIGAYVRFTFSHHHTVDLLISEIRNLPADERQEAAASQREYVDEWVHLLLQVHPNLSKADARVHIHAAIAVINDAARIARVRTADNGDRAVAAIAANVLGIDP